jgi:hypothetical protein
MLAVYGCLFVHTLTTVTAALPATLDKAVAREANLTRAAVAAQITPVVAKLDGQVTSLQTNLFARVDKIELDANHQLADLQTNAVTQIDDTRAALVKEVQDTRTPLLALLPPATVALTNVGTLAGNGAALAKDAQDSLDDSYWDVKGLLASTTVATQAVLTMETVRTESPVLLGHVSGISADFHDATTALDKKYFNPPPMNKKQKVLHFFSNFESLLIAALRGGAI